MLGEAGGEGTRRQPPCPLGRCAPRRRRVGSGRDRHARPHDAPGGRPVVTDSRTGFDTWCRRPVVPTGFLVQRHSHCPSPRRTVRPRKSTGRQWLGRCTLASMRYPDGQCKPGGTGPNTETDCAKPPAKQRSHQGFLPPGAGPLCRLAPRARGAADRSDQVEGVPKIGLKNPELASVRRQSPGTPKLLDDQVSRLFGRRVDGVDADLGMFGWLVG